MQKHALGARFCAPRASSSRIGRGTSALGLPPEQPRYDGAKDNARRASSSRAVGTGELYVPIPQRTSVSASRVSAGRLLTSPPGNNPAVATYTVNKRAVEKAKQLITGRQYVLDSDWGDVQPNAAAENAYLESHSWDEYGEWHLGLTEGSADDTKARHAFVYGDFRRLHRTGIIACHYRAAEWRHKEIELAAHELLQLLDETSA